MTVSTCKKSTLNHKNEHLSLTRGLSCFQPDKMDTCCHHIVLSLLSFLNVRLKCRKKTCKQKFIVEASYLHLEGLKQSQSDGGGGGGGGGNERKQRKNAETESPTLFVNSLLGASSFWPTLTSREQRGYQKSYPGADHYYVGCLLQTRVSLLSSSVTTSA